MSANVTTNFRLPKSLWRSLRRRAVEEDKSVAALLREWIEQHLGERPSDSQVAESQRKAIAAWSGRSYGPGFSGRDHDRILYGRGK